VLLAILAIDQQLRDCDWALRPRFAEHSQAGRLLRRHGLSYRSALPAVGGVPRAEAAAAGSGRCAGNPPASADAVAILVWADDLPLSRRQPMTPLLGRFMLGATWANVVEHAADPPDNWGSGVVGSNPAVPAA
jgi:hypothetical protein